jgi:hypothetical protein
VRKAPVFVAFALLAASGPAAPQAAKPAPPPVEERPAASSMAPSRPLNLKLDLPASTYTRDASSEAAAGKDAGNLPSLGGSAVPYERAPTPRMDSASPFPKDTAPGR